MTYLRTRRPFRSGSEVLLFGLWLLGFTGGCGGTVDQPSSPATVDRKIPPGWEQTKATMQERMKQMRKQGGPGRGATRR
jgi:hypothetical protein